MTETHDTLDGLDGYHEDPIPIEALLRDIGEALGAGRTDAGRSTYRPAGDYILDAPTDTPAVWGDPATGRVLWAKGEPLMLVGPTGVGKSSVMQQVVVRLVGLGDPEFLGLPVTRAEGRVLYLAADRPRQIVRSLRRMVTEADRAALNDRLVIRPGPPPRDLAANPELLLQLCREADAGTVIIDSLKDVAVGLSDDKVGSGLNLAIQYAIAADIEVGSLHHQRKGQNGEKAKRLEDVYGSTWLTAGAGSVVLLWGTAGDPLVELVHLKQPADAVGPLKLFHDHDRGVTTLERGEVDPLRVLEARPSGLTAGDLAILMFDGRSPTDSDRKRAKRQLDRLVTRGFARCDESSRGGEGGTQPARYYPIGGHLEASEVVA